MKNNRTKWEVAFGDDLNPFEGHSAIWVPPSAVIIDDNICFPVPDNWKNKGIAKQNMNELKNIGWYIKRDKEKPLNDFVALTNLLEKNNSRNLIEERLIKFSKKWGPLWLCYQNHFSDHHFHLWSRQKF